MPSHRCLWCTAVITTIATCGKNQVSPGQSLKYYVLSPEKLSEDKCISVCGSKECVYQSNLLHDFIKQDVDPCDDFYQFACGRIDEKLDPEEDYNIIQRYGDQLITKVKNILDTLEAIPTSASGKMKAVYDSCMKYSSSEFQISFTALEFLDNLGIPGWPNLPPEFKFVNTDISRVVANFLVYKEYGFVDFSSEYAFLDVDRNGGKVNTTVINSKSSYEKQDKPERMYMVNRILNYFKVDPEIINRVWEESEVIHDAIIKLREESILYHAQDSETGLLNCTERTENKWEELCDTLESLIEIAGTDDETNKDIAFIGKGEMHFMQNIFSVLRKFTDRSIANYLALNLFLNNLKDLNFYFHLSRKIQRNDDFMDVKISFLRSEKCIKWIITHMPIALGHEYLKENLTLPMLREIQDLGEECVREAVELISHQEWLTKDYRERLKENLIEKYTTSDLGNFLPSFPFSFKQQLYIYAVQDWCSVYSKERDELYYNFQSHSPDRFRVLGMMRNSKGFSEAFGCRNGTYMNAVTKCTILE